MATKFTKGIVITVQAVLASIVAALLLPLKFELLHSVLLLFRIKKEQPLFLVALIDKMLSFLFSCHCQDCINHNTFRYSLINCSLSVLLALTAS